MKKKLYIVLVSVVFLSLCAVAATSGILGRSPFRDIEIKSASVHLLPPDKTVQIVEIKELVEYLEDVVIYGKDNSHTEYTGQACTFTVIKTDGTEMEITAFYPFVIIDGVGYRCKYEPCQALNQYANRLLNR